MRYSPPYADYARVYDQIGQRAFGERMATVILDQFASSGIRPETILDLGCGTGAASMVFARSGANVTGVDREPAMVARATEAAEAAQLPIELLVGDMADLQLDRRFDLVTSIYDAVNYLEDQSRFLCFLQTAYRMLNAGGHLVFDMNTRHRLAGSWEQGMLLAGDSDDLFVTYRSWYDEQLGASPLVVTAFVRNGTCWQRFDEEHIERSWPINEVREWLCQVGFQIRDTAGYIDSTGDLVRPAAEQHGRVVFFATR